MSKPLSWGEAWWAERNARRFGAPPAPDQADDRPAALCLSGGGIRSATFSLGVIQGLARWRRRAGDDAKALQSFDYLSTVSGGGYVGAWLTRWVREDPNGIVGVTGHLVNDADPVTVQKLGSLRAYSNYLSPKRGLSTDVLTLVGIIGRNLLLNWLVIVPALALGLLVPRIATVSLLAASEPSSAAWPAWTALALGFAGVVTVVAFMATRLPPTPGGGKETWPFAWVLPASALAWAALWVLIARRSLALPFGIGLRDACVSLGIAAHLLGALVALLPVLSRAQQQPDAPSPLANLPKTLLAVLISGCAGGLLVWLGTYLAPKPSQVPAAYVVLAVPYLLFAFWLTTVLYSGMVGLVAPGERGEPSREWWARAGATSLRPLLIWVVVATLVLYGPPVLLWMSGRSVAAIVGLGGLGGVVSALAGLFGRGGVDERETTTPGWGAVLRGKALSLAAIAFLVVLVVVLTLVTSAGLAPDRNPILLPEAAEWAGSRTAGESIDGDVILHREQIEAADRYSRTFPGPRADPGSVNTVIDSAAAAKQEFAQQAIRDAVRRVLPPPWLDLEELKRRHVATALDPDIGPATVLALAGILSLILAVGWLLAGVNRFSLHAMYGNRLIRAYIGSARFWRAPNGFTDFDPLDDLPLQWTLRRPFHVVNCALNLTDPTTDQLAIQSRKATSFTLSPLHAGSPGTGYQPVGRYGGQHGITLGRAMTVSGAAVSPSMGYHSSPAVSAVMTLFNARLGWWLPNPAKTNPKLLARPEPFGGVFLLLQEAIGMTSDRSRWVHLSDGGHFDNLGLYEMVRRRCRLIVCVDATADADFRYDDLVRTMRMIRADLNVSIEFPCGMPAQGKPPARHWALARIIYPATEEHPAMEGLLVHLKPALTGDEPPDLTHYAATRKRVGQVFPHESTADQFFDEAQFESYRLLGLLTVDDIKTAREAHEFFDDLGPDLVHAGLPSAGSVSPPIDSKPLPANGSGNGSSGNGTSVLGRLASLVGPTAASAAMATTLAVGVAGTVRLTAPAEPIPLAIPNDAAVRLTGLDGAKVDLNVRPDTVIPVRVPKRERVRLDSSRARIPVHVPSGEAVPVVVPPTERVPLSVATSVPLSVAPDEKVDLDTTDDTVQCQGANGPAPKVAFPGFAEALKEQTGVLKEIHAMVEHIGPRRNVHGGSR